MISLPLFFRSGLGRRGFAYIVVMVFAAIMFIFLAMMSHVRSEAVNLLSKAQKDLMSNTVAEAGLNIALAEINLDPSFRTHWYYSTSSKWKEPVKKRASAIGNVSGVDLTLNGISNGAYSGETAQGEFKFRIAPVYDAKDNKSTTTLKESDMYVRAEVVAHIGDGKKSEEASYRRITAFIERRCPVCENLLFDGEILDIGMGPYPDVRNQLISGRIYGYQWIMFTSPGGTDLGSYLTKMEKIETPGMIQALKNTQIDFPDNTSVTLPTSADSGALSKNGYLLDGAHGAHPIKMTHLPKDSLYAKAKRRKNSGGFIIEKGTFPASKYKNPYDTSAEYVDIDFGEPHLRPDAVPDPPDSGSDTGNGSVDDQDDKDEGNAKNSDPPPGSDDGGVGSPIAKLRGRKLLIYSKVPLRIWGCPDRTTTIFSEKDIVIAGDFNQNPAMPQDYKDSFFQDYATPVKNGKDFHKVGALVMSMGRILIDISRPTLFLKNEMRPYFLYLLGMSLGPSDESLKDLPKQVCKLDPNPKNIGSLVGCGQPGADGKPTSNYYSIYSIYSLVKNGIATGPVFFTKIADFNKFLTSATEDDKSPHFGIRDQAARDKLCQMLIDACKDDGVLTNVDLNGIFEEAWKTAMKEEEEDPDPKLGAMGLVNGLFERARLAAGSGNKARTEGIYPPEITINAGLISSTRRASSWSTGNAFPKVLDEIGNVSVAAPVKMVEYIRRPQYIIQRVYGSEIRLASEEPAYFINGTNTCDTVLRRRYWDKTLLFGNEYQPTGLPYFHGILTFRDDAISKKEFDDF
ncbi:MAG: hypothetical protein HQM09_13880 [Candidatus Riflebacteria bacterium]|nr:hypothetical protein [Candidatus Riflebacteria bacterium]